MHTCTCCVLHACACKCRHVPQDNQVEHTGAPHTDIVRWVFTSPVAHLSVLYVDNCLFLYSYTLRNFTVSKTCTHAGTQDKRDDMTVGVRSTALLLGVRGTRTAGAAFAAAQAALLCAAGSAAGVGPAFYAGVMAGAAHQTWQLSTAKLNDPADCMAKFVSNKWYGAMIYAGIIGNQLL
jgi:4-hydroxybenzoate polyprenyltransferase